MMYIRLILIFGVLSVIGGGYTYYNSKISNLEVAKAQLEANNRTLRENQVQLELAHRTAEASLKAAEENAAKQSAAMNELTLKNNALQRDKDNAMRIFKDHNLTRLARAKPGMIEKRANNKTAAVFRDLENDTKELMDSDDADAPTGVQSNATVGVGPETGDNPTGTTDSNGDGEGTPTDIQTASSS
mgnify:CR=1 FL=1